MNYRNKDWRNGMRVTVDYNNMMKKSSAPTDLKIPR